MTDRTQRGPRAISAPGQESVRRFRLTELDGDRVGEHWQSTGEKCAVGAHPMNDLVLHDPTVSRFHCEIWITPGGPRVRDLSSMNGTVVDGVPVAEAFLRSGSLLQVGNSTLRFDLGTGRNGLQLSPSTRFGALVGRSPAMRSTFALLERAAASASNVLIEGPTGTGKGHAARAVHAASLRKSGPFIVFDCSVIPAGLMESELFGHERGAFTGADARRRGSVDQAAGGTLFLDEIGELPLELQPKLLRLLEEREYRAVGGGEAQRADVRIIAATNRDLRTEVNVGRFRSDLYYRLAVIRATLPPLAQHPEDIPLLVEEILGALGVGEERAASFRAPAFLAGLMRSAWPGNVRELRNHIERTLVIDDAVELEAGSEIESTYAEARKQALEAFEERFVRALLERHGGSARAAARAAEMDIKYLYKLIKRHGLK